MKNSNHTPKSKTTSSDSVMSSIPCNNREKYCITTGDKILHHLTYQQLEAFHKQIERLYQNAYENIPEKGEEYDIEIQKNITLYEDKKEPCISYCIYSEDCDIQMIPHSRIQKISELLQFFLAQDTIGLTPPSKTKDREPELQISISPDPHPEQRPPVFSTNVNINQCISCSYKHRTPSQRYMLAANELCSSWLTTGQLELLYRLLSDFLQNKK